MLSLTQKKILKLLAINCRFSNKDIGKAVGLSEDSVKYQIKKLIEENKYADFAVTFDLNKLGYSHYHYLIRYRNPDDDRINEIIKLREIFFVNTSYGSYDLQILCTAINEKEFFKIKNKIDFILKGNISDNLVLKYYRALKYTNLIPVIDVSVKIPKNQKNPIYKLNKLNFPFKSYEPSEPVTLSKTEQETVKYLMQNSRASYSEIARNTNQNYESVRQQIIKFVDKGYISNFGILPYFEEYNYFTSFFLLNILDLDEKEIKSYVENTNNIFYCAQLFGQYNLIIYMVADNPEKFNEEVANLRKIFKNKLLDIEMLTFKDRLKSKQIASQLFD